MFGMGDPLYSRLLELYFRPKSLERQSLYKILGVNVFRRWVVRLGRKTGHHSDRPNRYFLWDKSTSGLCRYERQTRVNELMHLAGTVIPAIGMIVGGENVSVDWLLGGILIVNLYPLLLQRYNRLRLCHAVRRSTHRLRGGH